MSEQAAINMEYVFRVFHKLRDELPHLAAPSYKDHADVALINYCDKLRAELEQSGIESVFRTSEISSLRAELAELRAQVPVEWAVVNEVGTRFSTVHSEGAANAYIAMAHKDVQDLLRAVPRYAHPVPPAAVPAVDAAAIAKAVRDIPSRLESLGGQRFAYVKLSEVIDTIYSVIGKQPAVPEAVAGGHRMSGCPKCGEPEIDAMTPRTVYACESSDYDQRPGTFKQSKTCAAASQRNGGE